MYTRKADLDVASRSERADSEMSVSMVVAAPNSCAIKADLALVERATDQIRIILAKTVGRAMDEVGQYLLREFYDNNPDAYYSKSHSKHASLALLAQRCQTMELPVRQTFLANALQIAIFSRQLPASSPFMSLPPSHRVELLKVGSPERADALAAKAIESRMSVKKLRDAVRKEREKNKSTRGRKPTPLVLKTLRVCMKALRDDVTGRLTFKRDDVDELSEEQLEDARSIADTLTKRIEEVMKLLG